MEVLNLHLTNTKLKLANLIYYYIGGSIENGGRYGIGMTFLLRLDGTTPMPRKMKTPKYPMCNSEKYLIDTISPLTNRPLSVKL